MRLVVEMNIVQGHPLYVVSYYTPNRVPLIHGVVLSTAAVYSDFLLLVWSVFTYHGSFRHIILLLYLHVCVCSGVIAYLVMLRS